MTKPQCNFQSESLPVNSSILFIQILRLHMFVAPRKMLWRYQEAEVMLKGEI